MYSTVIRQQHMIRQKKKDILSFIAQKYYKTKGSNTEQKIQGKRFDK